MSRNQPHVTSPPATPPPEPSPEAVPLGPSASASSRRSLDRIPVPEGSAKTVLVTGATGYIGGRLTPRLLERGHTVRVLVRDPDRIVGRSWAGEVEVVEGDIREEGVAERALEGVDAAYYLIHSMAAGADYAARDRAAAERFGAAARATGLAHVVYLGGLQPRGDRNSEHLASRREVGRILRDAVPATELRAGPIIGSGSASFEMVRYLTERLPVMVTPKWVVNPVQTIAVRDILSYLVLALERGPAGVVEVGTEALTFKEMMKVYADIRGLPRAILPLPVLAAGLAARWVGFVTPISNSLAVPLVRGMVGPVLADTDRARELYPEIEPISYRRAVELALTRIQEGAVETRWSGALATGPTYQLSDREGLVREVRTRVVPASQEAVYRAFTSLGGERGWLVWGWAWRLRGALDALMGGPGLRRGRRDPEALLAGEALDFWRVEKVDPPRLLRLRAEMKVPGRAWLEFRAEPAETGDGTRLVQAALFQPKGLLGFIYWYALYPVHKIIFSDMVRAVGRLGEEMARSEEPVDIDMEASSEVSSPARSS